MKIMHMYQEETIVYHVLFSARKKKKKAVNHM